MIQKRFENCEFNLITITRSSAPIVNQAENTPINKYSKTEIFLVCSLFDITCGVEQKWSTGIYSMGTTTNLMTNVDRWKDSTRRRKRKGEEGKTRPGRRRETFGQISIHGYGKKNQRYLRITHRTEAPQGVLL